MNPIYTALSREKIRFAIMLTLVVTVAGCSIEKPQAPSWNTTLRVPLVNRRYSSSEIFRKLGAGNIKSDSTGTSFFYVEKYLDTVSLKKTLSIDPINSSFAKQLGSIKVATPAPQFAPLVLSDYVPLIAGVVPDTGLWATKQIDQSNNFTNVSISAGSAVITFTNNTGFPIDSLEGQLRNSFDNTLIAGFVNAGGLGVGESYQQGISFAGKSLSSSSNLNIYFHTTGGVAFSLANRNLDITITFNDDIYASSITGKIDQFTTNYLQKTKLTDQNHIASATLAGGNLLVTLANQLPASAQLVATFPEITRNSAPLTISMFLTGNNSQQQNINLAGYTIQPQNDSLLVQVAATVQSSNNNFVTINSSNNFNITYNLSNASLTSLTGVIEQTNIDIADNQVSIDIPAGFDQAALSSVSLDITVENASGLSGTTNIKLEGSNGQMITISGSVSPKDGNQPSINHITSDQLASLLNPIPKTITISGTATVGDGITTTTVNITDFILADAVISAPLTFTMSDATVNGDKSDVTIGDDVTKKADRLQEGSFKTTINNHLPFGASLSFYIGADSATLFTNPLTIVGPIGFDRAPVNAQGSVTSDVSTSSSVTLNQNDLKVLENKRLYVAPVITLAGTQNQVVHINAGDYFEVNGFIEVTARVGGEGF